MDIKRIITEEVDELQWMKDIAKDSTVWEILDWKYGIYHQPNGIITCSYGCLDTWLFIKKVSTRKLFQEVTDTKWWKGIYNKDYWDMRGSLKGWKTNRFYELMALRDVQRYLSTRGTMDTGPR